MSTEEADARERVPGEKFKRVADRGADRGEEGATRDSSSSSSDGSNEHQPNQPNSDQGLIQRTQAVFETGIGNPALVSASHSQQAVTSAGTTQHFPPTTMESLQQEGAFQSHNPVQDMNLIHRNQLGVTPQNAFHAAHLLPSRTMGIVNHGILFPIDQSARGFGNINTYHLPTSNLPSEFRLESSSRMQLPQIQQLHNQTSLGSGSRGSPFMKTQWVNWNPQNQISMHEPSSPMGPPEIQFQGLLSQAAGSGSIFPNGGNSSQIQIPNLPIQQGMGSYNIGPSLPLHLEGLSTNYNRGNIVNAGQYEVGESSSRPVRMKMAWEENSPPQSNLQLASWIGQGHGTQGQNFIVPNVPNTRPRSLRSTVYDPMYEAIGVPVDPHLRMFVTRRESGNEEQ